MGWILLILVMLASGIVSWVFKSKFKKYGKVPMTGGLSGKEIAQKMLYDNNITDVQIISTSGQLTDHYNPVKKTVNLSPDVYNGRSIASAAVAAHECGHAVQHARAYTWLTMRSKLVPVVSVSSRWMQWVILGGILAMAFIGEAGAPILLAGIVLFGITTVFSFITLPVEFDASNRALNWLETTRMTNSKEHDMAKDALKWAAMTYVVAALGSLATLLYYISIYMNRR